MLYNDYGSSLSSTAASGIGAIIWTVLAVIFAIVGGILVYCLFLNPKKEQKLTGFLKWLKEFLSFKIMLIETILKICYLISTIFIILFSFTFIGTSFLAFIMVLVLGPVITRLIYEGSIMFIMVWKNIAEINGKLKK